MFDSGADNPVCLPNEPIYAETARIWRLAGRMVPGEQDGQWDQLVRFESGEAESGSGSE